MDIGGAADDLDDEPTKAKKRKYVECPPLCTSAWKTIYHAICKCDWHRKDDSKEADSEKEAAMEAELKAARERAVVPLEARMTQFKDMLLERGVRNYLNADVLSFVNITGHGYSYNLDIIYLFQVSAFSTWDKELHKIVFDPRYLLLNPKERKQVCLI